MLESNPPDAAVKRYAPPTQRNRSLNRRRSAEKFVKVNCPHEIEGEKVQGSYSRNFSTMDHGEAGNYYIQNETARSGLISLNGCSMSEASQLLNEHSALEMWTAMPRFRIHQRSLVHMLFRENNFKSFALTKYILY